MLTLYRDRSCVTRSVSRIIASHTAKHQHGGSSQVFSANKAKHTCGHVSLGRSVNVEEIIGNYGSAIVELPGDDRKGCGLGGASEGDGVANNCQEVFGIDSEVGSNCVCVNCVCAYEK